MKYGKNICFCKSKGMWKTSVACACNLKKTLIDFDCWNMSLVSVLVCNDQPLPVTQKYHLSPTTVENPAIPASPDQLRQPTPSVSLVESAKSLKTILNVLRTSIKLELHGSWSWAQSREYLCLACTLLGIARGTAKSYPSLNSGIFFHVDSRTGLAQEAK